MAEFRTIHSKMWRDSWYAELDVEGKLLWVYLITNNTASLTGIYHLPIRIAAFETGMSQERVQTLLAQFILSGKIEYENEIVWIRRMRKYQAANETSPKIAPRIQKDLDEIPDCKVKRLYMTQYHTNTILIPTRTDTETDTDQETETETDQETEIIGAPAPAKSKPDKSKLRFDITPEGASMAQKLRAVYESKGYRPPEFYANAAQRDAYLTAFMALESTVENVLDSAMQRDIVDRGKLLGWLQGCVKRNGNGRKPQSGSDGLSVLEKAIAISARHDAERESRNGK